MESTSGSEKANRLVIDYDRVRDYCDTFSYSLNPPSRKVELDKVLDQKLPL